MTDATGLQWGPELTTALEAVAAACRVTRAVQMHEAGIRSMAKSDASPVTVADFAAQAVVARSLRNLPAPLCLVAEENTSSLREAAQAPLLDAVVVALQEVWPEAERETVLDAIDAGDHDASAAAFWTLDPVDGTKGFLRQGQYAISLARIEQGEVTLGVLGCPNLSADLQRPFDAPDPQGMLFIAQRGRGAWCLQAGAPAGGVQRVAATRQDTRPFTLCESVESGHSDQEITARILAALQTDNATLRLDSQCKYAVVARGQADAYLRIPTRPGYVEKIWDHAAGCLVAREAGAIVSDIAGAPLDFSTGSTLARNRGVICALPEFHDRLLGIIRQQHPL